jgi:hypothetical protein
MVLEDLTLGLPLGDLLRVPFGDNLPGECPGELFRRLRLD